MWRSTVRLYLLLLLAAAVATDVTRTGRGGYSSSNNSNNKRKKAGAARRCLDLPEETLEQMLGRLSVGVLQAFHHTLQLAPAERHPHLNLTCPAAGRPHLSATKSRVPVNLLSLSPWAYRVSHDPARYPRFIPEAYCLCTGCLTGPGGKESTARYRSTPVYTPSVILRRTGACVAGRHAYVESYVSVAVGCTCVPLLPEDRRDTQSGNRRAAPKLGGGGGGGGEETAEGTTGNKIV